MPEGNPPSQPARTEIIAKFACFDRRGFMGLIHDLQAAQKGIGRFFMRVLAHTNDALRPSKGSAGPLALARSRNQNTSGAKAKQAISGYRKAVGGAAGLEDLMVLYCEHSAGFCNDFGIRTSTCSNRLKVMGQLPAPYSDILIAWLDRVRVISHNFGYGNGDMDSLLVRHSEN